MAFLKSVLTFVAVFTLFGGVLGTLLAPSMVTGELCGFAKDTSSIRPCVDTVERATASVLRYQRYGAIGGAGLGLVLGIGWNLRRKKQPPATAATTPAAPA